MLENQHFLLFPQWFLPFPKQKFSVTFILSPANAFNLDQSKILSFGKELNEGNAEKMRLKLMTFNTILNDCTANWNVEQTNMFHSVKNALKSQ